MALVREQVEGGVQGDVCNPEWISLGIWSFLRITRP